MNEAIKDWIADAVRQIDVANRAGNGAKIFMSYTNTDGELDHDVVVTNMTAEEVKSVAEFYTRGRNGEES